MEPQSGDTIAAVATAPGRGAVGIVRVSGPDACRVAESIIGSVPKARTATRARFADAAGEYFDDGLVLFFRGPHSYTGEDLIEFHGHGGGVVLAGILDRCVGLGARLAAPGEFTKRAFLNGKLELAAAEAVADIIEAASMEAARAAVRALRGELDDLISGIDVRLLQIRGSLEATLDFPEDDLDTGTFEAVRREVDFLLSDCRHVLVRARRGRLLRDGVGVVFLGAPNVGKSSLFNRLAGADIAIVTDIPGTTRDVLRAELEIDGVCFRLIDTAGWRDTDDVVERAGIERAGLAAAAADVVVLVGDGRPEEFSAGLRALKEQIVETPILHVRNKCDLDLATHGDPERSGPAVRDEVVPVSARTGAGIEALKRRLLEMVGWTVGDGSVSVLAAQARHIDCLERAASSLGAATLADLRSPELMAEELRQAHDAIGEILGRTLPDEVLGEIFARFCIGK